jgi:hypothetical protein
MVNNIVMLQILSDSQRRAHYDIYLRSQKRVLQKHPRPSHHVYPNPSGSGIVVTRESNVVEWLKWYRLTIDDIVTKKRVATGSGYFDKLESELYTAIHAAYYGPDVRSVDLLPDCFEAEERSVYETPELLHLVSGRDLFGIVSLADRVQQLPDAFQEKQTLPGFKTYGISQHVSTNLEKGTVHASPVYIHKREIDKNDGPHSDAYKDIELWICGKLVATATRSPKCNCIDKSDVEDHIHVFLVPNEVASSDFTQELPILGTITGLATTGEEGSCCVYDSRGIKTHLIVKHRTLMVCTAVHIYHIFLYTFKVSLVHCVIHMICRWNSSTPIFSMHYLLLYNCMQCNINLQTHTVLNVDCTSFTGQTHALVSSWR